MANHPDTDEVVIDTAMLREAFRPKARAWLPRGLLAVVVGVVLALAIVPQSYTSTSTVSVQQASSDSGTLAMLTGSKSNTRYIGILRSRTSAETVIGETRYLDLYTFKSKAERVDYLEKHLKVADDAETGLLDISVTLPGPPKLSFGTSAKRHAVQELAADMTNAYVDVLRAYYANNDNDREAVILRSADAETAQARSDYEYAIRRLSLFSSSLKSVDPRSIPNPGKNDAPPAVDELGDLYSALAKVETQLTALQAAQGSTDVLVAGQLSNLGQIPTEDPLLAAARARVSQDQADLQSLQVTYGPDHPSVILAKSRLKVDQMTLRNQVAGVAARATTQQVAAKADIQDLFAQKSMIQSQIAAATVHLQRGANISGSLERLKAEVDISLAVLKETLTEAARVRMEYASVQSRIGVVDVAIPSDEAQPRTSIVAVAVVALVLLAYIVAALLEYSRLSGVAELRAEDAVRTPEGRR